MPHPSTNESELREALEEIANTDVPLNVTVLDVVAIVGGVRDIARTALEQWESRNEQSRTRVET